VAPRDAEGADIHHLSAEVTMSHENTQLTNEPQDDAHRIEDLSDEALDDLISTDTNGSLGAWDR
jgi:hypothetical protein